MRLFESLLKPLEKTGIEAIAEETRIDEYPKKLKLEAHIRLLVYSSLRIV